jgi:hypothetical protein
MKFKRMLAATLLGVAVATVAAIVLVPTRETQAETSDDVGSFIG